MSDEERRRPGGSSSETTIQGIYQEYREPLLRFLQRQVLGDHYLAEDMLQEVFLRAWRHRETLAENPARVAPWLYTVARNVAIDAARARQSRPPEAVFPDFNLMAAGDDAVDQFVSSHVVRNGLREISEEHRAVLAEIYFRRASIAEAAARLGIPEGTVKSRTYYAVRALHAAIGSTEAV